MRTFSVIFSFILFLFMNGVSFAKEVSSSQSPGYQNRCYSGQWYSYEYGRCYDKYGRCGQYNYTDYRTCNTSKDAVSCDWDRKRQTCYSKRSGGGDCGYGYWYSRKYNSCFKIYGKCAQYNGTDSRTCNSPKDKMRCDWDSYRRICYFE